MRPHRSLVVASLPSQCGVCRGEERVRCHPPNEPHQAIDIDCPHCLPTGIPIGPYSVSAGIPILHLSAHPRGVPA